jgi:hypothetical protein
MDYFVSRARIGYNSQKAFCPVLGGTMYNNILIPTGGSELAGKAVQHGITPAKRIGAKTTLVTVLPPFHIFTTDCWGLRRRAADAGRLRLF